MRVLITLEYLGTAYCGWQRQKNGISVQETVANALAELTGEKIVLHGSGRTDAGVHALSQAAHFDTNTNIPVEKLPFAINKLMPEHIAVKSSRRVPDDFHARYDAISKTYLYKIYTAAHKSPIRENTHCHITNKLDINLMTQAANVLIGKHDFKCFQASGGHVVDTVRTIYELSIKAIDDEIHIEVKGNGFLYNMVRIIAGTLVYIGAGKMHIEDLQSALLNRDRTKAGKTLSAKGLYLKQVEYNI